MQPFYRYGQLTAVLEQGARAQGQIPWLELYYPRGFLPWVGLRDPLRKHMQSVLPFLERRGRAERYVTQLNSLANDLPPKSQHRTRKASTPGATATCPTTAAPSPNFPTNPRPGTRRSTPRATWLNGRPSSPSAHRCQETRTPGSSARTTTRTGCSPGTSPATTRGCRQVSNRHWLTDPH